MSNPILATFTAHATKDPRWPAFQAMVSDALSMLAGGTVQFTEPTREGDVSVIGPSAPVDDRPIMYDACTDTFRPATQADFDKLLAHLAAIRRSPV